MKQIQPTFFFRRRSNSLFIRLIAGFMCIIVLLVSLTIYSFSVSKRNVKQELVKYNTMMLDNAKNGYEKHLDLIKKQMYLFFSEVVPKLQNDPKYSDFPQLVHDINNWTTNPYLFIDNIVFFSKQRESVLEKKTSTSAQSMFTVFYSSEAYSLDFWKQQFNEPYTYRVLPTAVFSNLLFRDVTETLGHFLPIVFKYDWSPDLYMIVFLDADKMYEAFQQSIYDDFIIYDENGQMLYQTEGQEPFPDYAALQEYGKDEFIRDNNYYFIKRGQVTGNHYVYRVPAQQIAYQTRLNITLVVILIAAILLSIVIAILFAIRINNPLKKVIESLRSMNEAQPFRSSISEFNIISDEIRGNQQLRRQFGFLNRLKAIRSNEFDSAGFDFADKPYVFVLYQIQPLLRDSMVPAPIEKWLYYVKTFIDSQLKPAYPDSMTFQIERDRILSLVFTERHADLYDQLRQMKDVFDHDKEYGIVTIAVSSIHSSSDQLTAAYEETLQLFGERRLTGETQIISGRAVTPTSVGFSPDQDKEFAANLSEGNAQQLTALLERLFAKWQDKDLPAAVLFRFAESIVGKIRNAAVHIPLESERLEAIVGQAEERIERCVTVRELEQLLLEWVIRAADAVKEKKQEKHPITDFVIDYVNEHLSEEIYLDVLADKLKMNSSYLSYYFKGKTGKNIVDFINETRIAKATSLLSDNRSKIHDVAKAVGYQNITSFNRMFKKYMGMTPSEYRKRNDSSL